MIFHLENKKATVSASGKPEVEANGYKCLQSSHLHTSGPRGGSWVVVSGAGGVGVGVTTVSLLEILASRCPAGQTVP